MRLQGSPSGQWRDDPRWRGIERGYSAADVVRLRGSVHIEYTLARRGAERLWKALETEPCVRALGAVTGNQAVQMAKAGLQSIYLSGWQVAADANNAGQMYPDQSLYPADSAPDLIRNDQRAPWRGQTRFTTPKVTIRSTGSCPSSPMRRPASAAC